MSVETYGEDSNESIVRKFYLKFFVFLVFIIILGVVIYSVFGFSFLDKTLSGNVIRGNNDSFLINGELNVPEIDFKGEVGYLEIRGDFSDYLTVGDQKFDLGEKNVQIVIYNYSGGFLINSNSIEELSGKAERVFVDRVLVKHDDGDNLKIKFRGNVSYKFVEVRDIEISKIDSIGSGSVNIGGKRLLIDLEDEDYIIGDFVGDFKIVNKRFDFEGKIRDFRVKGERDIRVG